MTSEQAWAAGVFEGEGSFLVHRTRRAGREYRYPAMSLVSTDLDVVERVRAAMGVGQISVEFRRGHSLGSLPLYRWRVTDRLGFIRAAAVVLPLLGERRLRRLAEVCAEVSPVARQPFNRHRINPTEQEQP